MPRPHAASIVEDAWNRRVTSALRQRGWGAKIIPFTGYGSSTMVRVLGRVLLSRTPDRVAAADAGAQGSELRAAEDIGRGWRAFINTPPSMDVPVQVTVNGRVVTTRTDRSGIVDLVVRGHGLGPGWHVVRIDSPGALGVDATVLVIGTTTRFGIISDIDDTCLSTYLPRPLVAGWNTFVRPESSRTAIIGMATLYREIRATYPDAPVIYLSTGAWNLVPTITRFFRRNGFPPGPMLMTDWGPTNAGWFRSGQDHKRSSLHRLAREFPHMRWLLVGDDGQHDPKIYTEFAGSRPDAVTAIAIRQLSAGEQVLSHGLPVANDELSPAPTEDIPAPVLRAPDGFLLAEGLRPVLGLPSPVQT